VIFLLQNRASFYILTQYLDLKRNSEPIEKPQQSCNKSQKPEIFKLRSYSSLTGLRRVVPCHSVVTIFPFLTERKYSLFPSWKLRIWKHICFIPEAK